MIARNAFSLEHNAPAAVVSVTPANGAGPIPAMAKWYSRRGTVTCTCRVECTRLAVADTSYYSSPPPPPPPPPPPAHLSPSP
ncbi:unnamed protein product [Danaus chrysippus]|uniref:(African queen) hypothetical protein n=1 Tax=Danaus chrysippus TaxID=151541 RepID=A0A8J2RJY0_9NEOP|nr:unnamed protein product [Danaus chrysippus]